MKKSELAKRFRAVHSMHGYRLEYTNYKKTWVCHTSYASYYDELKDPMEIPYWALIQFRYLIIHNSLK